MSNIEFDADKNAQSSYPGVSGYSSGQNGETKGITGWLIKKGLAKNTRMATIICTVIVIANLAIMFWSWTHSQDATPPSNTPAGKEMPGHYVNTINSSH